MAKEKLTWPTTTGCDTHSDLVDQMLFMTDRDNYSPPVAIKTLLVIKHEIFMCAGKYSLDCRLYWCACVCTKMLQDKTHLMAVISKGLYKDMLPNGLIDTVTLLSDLFPVLPVTVLSWHNCDSRAHTCETVRQQICRWSDIRPDKFCVYS